MAGGDRPPVDRGAAGYQPDQQTTERPRRMGLSRRKVVGLMVLGLALGTGAAAVLEDRWGGGSGNEPSSSERDVDMIGSREVPNPVINDAKELLKKYLNPNFQGLLLSTNMDAVGIVQGDMHKGGRRIYLNADAAAMAVSRAAPADKDRVREEMSRRRNDLETRPQISIWDLKRVLPKFDTELRPGLVLDYPNENSPLPSPNRFLFVGQLPLHAIPEVSASINTKVIEGISRNHIPNTQLEKALVAVFNLEGLSYDQRPQVRIDTVEGKQIFRYERALANGDRLSIAAATDGTQSDGRFSFEIKKPDYQTRPGDENRVNIPNYPSREGRSAPVAPAERPWVFDRKVDVTGETRINAVVANDVTKTVRKILKEPYQGGISVKAPPGREANLDARLYVTGKRVFIEPEAIGSATGAAKTELQQKDKNLKQLPRYTIDLKNELAVFENARIAPTINIDYKDNKDLDPTKIELSWMVPLREVKGLNLKVETKTIDGRRLDVIPMGEVPQLLRHIVNMGFIKSDGSRVEHMEENRYRITGRQVSDNALVEMVGAPDGRMTVVIKQSDHKLRPGEKDRAGVMPFPAAH